MAVGAAETGWVVPVNLHDPRIRSMPVGKIYHTITSGKIVEGNVIMPAYGSQISAEDRWAITAYIRALQWSQKMPAELVPADLKAKLDEAPVAEDLTPSEAPSPVAAVTADTPKFKLTADEKKLVDTGKQLFQTKICFTCHQVDPAVPTPAGVALKAPIFMGAFWGTEREVHNGPGGPIVKVKLDTAYFTESIKQPMAKIVKGAIPGMAPLPTTDEEIKALEAYVKSLSANVEK